MGESLAVLAVQVGEALQRRGWSLATAESCTGGWIAKTVTDIPGSSGWFQYGFVTYSNQAKLDLLAVPEATLVSYGAVSGETVAAMAEGALARSRADVAVAVSGIAGPDGGTEDKPVGTVWLAWATRDGRRRQWCEHFAGDRAAVRQQSVTAALVELLNVCAG